MKVAGHTAASILCGVLSVAIATSSDAATFSIRSIDSAGEGLNDTAAFAPVGGNSATTLGQARMNVLLEAARIWGLLLQSSVPIQVDAAFDPQTCSATSGTLGSAGPRAIYRNFGGGVSPDTFYVSALADALAGANQSSSATSADIGATFNSNIDGDPVCLGGRGFYYGFDHNRGNKVDLLLVVLHEFGHGLGFTSQINLTTGRGFVGSDNVERFDSYTYRLFDEQFGSAWPALTDTQRVESASHSGSLAWSGVNVNAQGGRFTQGLTAAGRVRIYAPATVSSGSSVSHFDSALTPSVLMEPNLPSSITTSSTDITVCALQDVGWTVTMCPHDTNNQAPVATSKSVTTAEDTAVVITLTGTDVEGNALTFAIATPPMHGSLSSLSSTMPRTVTYRPSANFNGSDSFTFTANDGVLSSAAGTVSLTISSVNDVPIAQDTFVTATSGQPVNVTLFATDVDGDVLSYTANDSQHGTISGTGATLVYRSVDGYTGLDTFTFRVNDGAANSALATVSITVLPAPQTTTANFDDGGGGGAVSISWLVLLASLALLHSIREIGFGIKRHHS